MLGHCAGEKWLDLPAVRADQHKPLGGVHTLAAAQARRRRADVVLVEG